MLSRTKGVVSVAVFSATIALLGTAALAQDKKTIALVYGVKGDPFYVTMEKGARAKAEELGFNFIADGPSQWNPVLQTPIVDAMTARRVDGLVVVPNDPQALVPALQRANDSGIPIVTNDQYIGDGDYAKGAITFPLSFVASDNFLGGQIACKALIDGIGGKGKIYIQTPSANVPTDIARTKGCIDAINKTGGAVQSAGVDYNNQSATTATTQTQAVLQKTNDLSAIFGTNLYSSQGAAAAVKSANLTGTIKIANFDAPEQAIDELRNKTVDLVVAQKPAEMGAIAVQYLADALKGKTADIPRKFATPYVIITRENVDSPEAQAAIYKAE